MADDPNTTHGLAHQSSFMEVPLSDIPALFADEELTNVGGTGEVEDSHI